MHARSSLCCPPTLSACRLLVVRSGVDNGTCSPAPIALAAIRAGHALLPNGYILTGGSGRLRKRALWEALRGQGKAGHDGRLLQRRRRGAVDDRFCGLAAITGGVTERSRPEQTSVGPLARGACLRSARLACKRRSTRQDCLPPLEVKLHLNNEAMRGVQ